MVQNFDGTDVIISKVEFGRESFGPRNELWAELFNKITESFKTPQWNYWKIQQFDFVQPECKWLSAL